ncbi:N-acetylmuramoyl-L-alanine amidase [bacterium]|nr:N-acetylmuramoyl-L-alanine amidase [bacterium]
MTLNRQSIHIEVVGSRTDTEQPADMPQAQADAIVSLIDDLQTKYPHFTVTAHSLVDKNK